jgi:hypothetical protein
MFEPRNILYFDPFYFKNGNNPKAKYFVVLKTIDNKAILASLPTSHDHIPEYSTQKFGCIELPDANFNCFALSPTTCVTECDKCFPRKTFMYGQNIDEYNINDMRELYPLENINYSVWGKMKQCLYEDLILCFRNSKSIKRKYKRLL